MKRIGIVLLILPALFFCSSNSAQQEPIAEDWGLKIVVFDFGQADGAVILARNGDAAIVDMGKYKRDGLAMAEYLLDEGKNGVGRIDNVPYLFTTHYDQDHIGGANGLGEKGITVREAFDQGISVKRNPTDSDPKAVYGRYIKFVGDPNDNCQQDAGEPNFARIRAEHGMKRTLGDDNEIEIFVLSVRGDTEGAGHDIANLDPSSGEIDENPGSIALLIRYGDFEYLTCGDATSDDFRYHEPDTEIALINAEAIPGGHDIDVFKVNHHGSDTSNGSEFIEAIRPEVAIITSEKTRDNNPEKTTLKALQEVNAVVLMTGKCSDDSGNYHNSASSYDDDYTVNPALIKEDQGNVTIYVAKDGKSYLVSSTELFSRIFDSVDK